MSPLAGCAPCPNEHIERQGHHPIWIPPTSKRAYLTGYQVLNLTDPLYPDGGDWHRACWQVPVEGVPTVARTATIAQADELAPLMHLFEANELHDYRGALREVGHPAARRPTPVWGASHVRAVLEMAWEYTALEGAETQPEELLQTVDPQTVARWLAEPMQWLKLQWWAWRIQTGPARVIGAESAWREWRRHLTPYADYRAPERTFARWLYPTCACLAIASAVTRRIENARKTSTTPAA